MNILLLSNIYPLQGPENQGTKVCHYFAKEWVAMGHRVRVIHFQATYPSVFYILARLFQKKIASKTGAVVYTKKEKKITTFLMDGVEVTRIPLQKNKPHGKFPASKIKKSVDFIVSSNERERFIPEIILGHFLNPQLEVLSILKQAYRLAKTGLVFHLPAEICMAEKLYGNKFQTMLDSVDVLGFRNEPLKNDFEKRFVTGKKCFVCYSGIPESYIVENPHHYEKPLKEFIYVGSLIKRKFPAQILDALHEVYPKGGFMMNYVGDGQQRGIIEQKIEQYGIDSCVTLHGKIDRDRILNLYDQSDCMIMISSEEAYGLVYLEAMARGCITIASRDEGMDGIIVDGYNGFLCQAGDAKELARLIERINSLSKEKKEQISSNAIKTANELTDSLVAKRYLNDVKA